MKKSQQLQYEGPTETPPKRSEAKGLIMLSVGIIFLACLLSFHHGHPQENWLGLVGYGIGFTWMYFFGLTSYLAAFLLLWVGWNYISREKTLSLSADTIYLGICFFSLSILLNLGSEMGVIDNPLIQKKVYTESVIISFPYPHKLTRFYMGGAPTYFILKDLPYLNLERLLSPVGVFLTFGLSFTVSFLLLSKVQFLELLAFTKRLALSFFGFSKKLFLSFRMHRSAPQEGFSYAAIEESLGATVDRITRIQHPSPTPVPFIDSSVESSFIAPYIPEGATLEQAEFEPIEQLDLPPPIKGRKKEKQQEEEREEPSYVEQLAPLEIRKPIDKTPSPGKKYAGEFKNYKVPTLSLLTAAKKIDQPQLQKDLEKRAKILEETLLSFGIEAKVGEIYCGPTITSFEVHPPIGVKVQKIKVLENDIALNMQAKSIRIIAPIPGKAAVGVEVPSLVAQEVGFKEMLASYQKKGHKFHIPVILGKTVSGEDVISDLTKMPHCIIAGATGSGKSVCINAIVLSILMNLRPDEVKLILIDPKKVELSGYTKLPHMIAPVITEAAGAHAALQWLVREMQDRYEILKLTGQRNIHSFNSRKVDTTFEESLDREIPKKLFFIVCIIDEFADLMMASQSDLETPIARIAQMARAVGIHMILATQRPSREVITGLIKANFPTRISFKVASRVNSQIILDENGAEALLGNGDMLFLPPGTSQLIRCQGAYIRDEDINAVIEHIETQAPADYLIKSFDHPTEDLLSSSGATPQDELYEKAYALIVDTRNASTTFLQRKLKIGYARAAALMDELESRGVVSPADGSRGRQVLVGLHKKAEE